MTEHTDLPWVHMTIHETGDLVILQQIDSNHAKEPVLALVSNQEIEQQTAEANAAIIVKAVNHHAELVAVLRSMTWDAPHVEFNPEDPLTGPPWVRAEAILSKIDRGSTP